MVSAGQRGARLAEVRNLKMARSAHAYVRGSTANFYDWLEASPADVPQGPPIWICGDCHIGNLGPLADRKGRVAVQIRDLDQTVIGNPAHDLIRLGLSLASAARGSDLPGVVTARVLERVVAGYHLALRGALADETEETLRPPAIGHLLERSVRRRWRHLAAERLEGVEPTIPLGKRFWMITDEEREALRALVDDEAVNRRVAHLGAGAADAPLTIVDAAYWMKGCSSLGRLRYAVMLQVGHGKQASSILLDIKEAVTAAAPRQPGAAMPRDQAERVVAGALALSPNLGQRMIAGKMLGRSVVLRELMPQDLKVEVGRLTSRQVIKLAAYLGWVVGRAHARQLNAADLKAWRGELKPQAAGAGGPAWLWTSVVDLIGIHERAYLEHCRRHVADAAQRLSARQALRSA